MAATKNPSSKGQSRVRRCPRKRRRRQFEAFQVLESPRLTEFPSARSLRRLSGAWKCGQHILLQKIDRLLVHAACVVVRALHYDSRIKVLENNNRVSAISGHVPTRDRAAFRGVVVLPEKIAILVIRHGPPVWTQSDVDPGLRNDLVASPLTSIRQRRGNLCCISCAKPQAAPGHRLARWRVRPLPLCDSQRRQELLFNVLLDWRVGRALDDLTEQKGSGRAIAKRT